LIVTLTGSGTALHADLALYGAAGQGYGGRRVLGASGGCIPPPPNVAPTITPALAPRPGSPPASPPPARRPPPPPPPPPPLPPHALPRLGLPPRRQNSRPHPGGSRSARAEGSLPEARPMRRVGWRWVLPLARTDGRSGSKREATSLIQGMRRQAAPSRFR